MHLVYRRIRLRRWLARRSISRILIFAAFELHISLGAEHVPYPCIKGIFQFKYVAVAQNMHTGKICIVIYC